MAQMRAEINYKRTIEAAKLLEQSVLTNTNTIFGSDDHRHQQINSDVGQSSNTVELDTGNENVEIIVEDDSESSANEDISDEWKAVLKEWSEDLVSEESVETESSFSETEEMEDLFSNELLVGLNHPAVDPKGKWKLANLFDFEFSTPSPIKNLMKFQEN